ncbi:mediator of RNA polymerase II transcription subunit 24-like isoform X10 [Dreissena polymorpha]|uniref:mediator of RNA polymerase II transcription subunit 24-like isoform X6 n=1 Tax=Dreissena polymorpha TaxID=45954 RepID=UPI002264771D|nr:mediator of RNA polymerase II transcription subunit 24-like isoform X6 [Dreissena polymorpha]XP_052248774.1 mediator of RNA polymerase II transcription subunit 24-like isoform X7 [Dreissena polymorpha]XP_052248775.1 mediator of RNA polymerase II transcription subunit 24-like isoform X8 [Dreissena polymorpha]XP_052248776.1 mediator of RNA polymerase II transcription subunit 24-like isoform X6 [Dreissena polymorpha]XP_052248777.1 mediator of RNA polymerase II transcription subunit 24-like isof
MLDPPQQSIQDNSSVANKLKVLMVRAWRERWSEIQWGIYFRRLLISAGPGTDTKELAEVLLNEALVGAHPNNLVLSYLQHATLAKLLPVSASFQFISGYEGYNKPHCVLALVDFVKHMTTYMGFSYGSDGGPALCQCLQSLVHWLLKVMLRAVQMIQEPAQLEYQTLLQSATAALQAISQSDTISALLYIAKTETSDVFSDMEQTELNMRGTLSQIPQDAIPQTLRGDISNLEVLKIIKCYVQATDAVLDTSHIPICPTIVAMVAVEAVLNPNNDIQPFVDQLFIIEKLMKLKRSYLFSEVLRGCYMGLVDLKQADSQEDYRWCAFTYLKVPQILQKVQQQSPSRDFAADLEAGFDRLLYSGYMLDLADSRHNCDLLGLLLGECTKASLLSEAQLKRIYNRRNNESLRSRSGDQQISQSNAGRIIKAEPTVNSILKTLEADYSKNQESLLGVLQHMLSGKSFELILNAAAAIGKLQIFLVKLIRFNEFAKQSSGESGKASQTRALLFDISFLMLAHITQIYGSELITGCSECQDTFFTQWVTRCLPEDGKYKSVDIGMPVEPSKVDFLLSALTSGSDIAQGPPKWHEICTNTPYAIQEVLFAWEHGSISSDNIKMILNYIKTRMLSLPVCIVAWLCSYINMLSEEARTKPLSILQQLIQPLQGDSLPQYYSERSYLMQPIVQKMIHDILPPASRRPIPQYVPANSLPADVMAKTLKAVFSKGWLETERLHALKALYSLCGADWFVDRLVRQMLESNRIDDITKSLSLAYAIMHMDMEHLALSLLLHTIPSLLLSAASYTTLTDSRGYTLAKFCVLTITAAQAARSTQKDVRRGRKRSRNEFDLDDVDDLDGVHMQAKRMKMEPQITLDSEGFNFDFLNVKDESDTAPVIDSKDPLNKALLNLFRLMNAVVHDGEVSQKTSFIVSLVDEAVNCGQHARYILQFMPPNMLSQMMRCMPAAFDNSRVLQICDISNSTGRKIAVKAVCQNARRKSY